MDDVNWFEALESQEREDLEKGVANLSVSSSSAPDDEDDKPTTKAEASLLTEILYTKEANPDSERCGGDAK